MGLRSLFARHKNQAPTPFPAQTVVGEPLMPEQLADLDSARAELLQLPAEAGVKSLNACPRDGSRWQDDPKTIRTITALIRETHLKEQTFPEDSGPPR